MKPSGLIYCCAVVCAVFAFGGCMSMSSSPNPRFYMLQSVNPDEVKQKFNAVSNMFVGLDTVKIPEYQNRPQITTQNEDQTLNFAQFDRWGAPLDLALTRVIAADMAAMLPGATVELLPCNHAIPIKYQVIIEVVQLESRLDKDMFVTAQWSLINLNKNELLLTKRSEFRQPVIPHDYSGLAKTLSAACAALSGEIAGNLAAKINEPETKRESSAIAGVKKE